jgi:hypothetical protein
MIVMEPIRPVLSDDGMKFEYVVGKLLSDIVNPIQREMRDEQDREKASFVFTLAKALGLREYKDEFDA